MWEPNTFVCSLQGSLWESINFQSYAMWKSSIKLIFSVYQKQKCWVCVQRLLNTWMGYLRAKVLNIPSRMQHISTNFDVACGNQRRWCAHNMGLCKRVLTFNYMPCGSEAWSARNKSVGFVFNATSAPERAIQSKWVKYCISHATHQWQFWHCMWEPMTLVCSHQGSL